MVAPGGTVAVEWTLAIVSCCLLILRLYVRRYIARTGIQREDYLLIVAQCLFFTWISLDAFTISQGFMDGNRSYFDNFVTPMRGTDAEKVRVLKVVYSSSVPYYLCLWIIKFAILGLYFRIIPKDSKSRIFLKVSTVFTFAVGVAVLLINVFLCRPISSNWSLDYGNACYSSTAVTPFIISVICNLVTDFLIFAIPFPTLRKVSNLGKKQKIGILVTFSLGVVTILICIVRAVIIALHGSISMTAIFTAVETFTALVVAILPALKILLKTKSLRREKKSTDTEDSSVSMSVSNTDYEYSAGPMDYTPRGLPVRQDFKSGFGNVQEQSISHAYDPTQNYAINDDGAAKHHHHPQSNGQHQYAARQTDGFQSPGSMSDMYTPHHMDQEDYEIEDPNEERVQMVSLTGGRSTSPLYDHQPYGAFPTSSISSITNPRQYQQLAAPQQQQQRYMQPHQQLPQQQQQQQQHYQQSQQVQQPSGFASRLQSSQGNLQDDPLPLPPSDHLQSHVVHGRSNSNQRDPFMPDYLSSPAPNPSGPTI